MLKKAILISLLFSPSFAFAEIIVGGGSGSYYNSSPATDIVITTNTPGATNFIIAQGVPQSGAEFNIASGTISGQFSVGTIKFPDGSVQVSSATDIFSSSAPLTYVSNSSAAATYAYRNLTVSNSSAAATYLNSNTASLTYLSQSSAAVTYSNANNVLYNSSASVTYANSNNTLSNSSASVTYANVNNVLLNSSASVTYANINNTLSNSSATATYVQVSSANANFIRNGNILQSGTTFYVSSGTVSGTFSAANILCSSSMSVKGITNGTESRAGDYGESVSTKSTGTGIVGTSGQYADIVSTTLAAGDWDISGGCYITGSNVTDVFCGVGTSAGNNAAGLTAGDNFFPARLPTATIDGGTPISVFRVNITSNTTYYLKIYSTYTSAIPKASGRISARRAFHSSQ